MAGAGLEPFQKGEVPAHADDLGGAAEVACEILDDGRLEPHRALLEVNVRPAGIAKQPALHGKPPDIGAMAIEETDRPHGNSRRQKVLAGAGQSRTDQHGAVEAGHRRREVQRLDQHAQARGGRLLMIEKAMPAARTCATASRVRLVSTLSSVTSVPSTSETRAEILFFILS